MSDTSSGPRNKLLTGVDPTDDQPDEAPLAEGEGVNAGSADQTDEDTDQGGQDDGATGSASGTRAGGHPEDAPDPKQGLTGYGAAADDAQLLGTPDDDPREPSQPDGSSGQDSGSMD